MQPWIVAIATSVPLQLSTQESSDHQELVTLSYHNKGLKPDQPGGSLRWRGQYERMKSGLWELQLLSERSLRSDRIQEACHS